MSYNTDWIEPSLLNAIWNDWNYFTDFMECYENNQDLAILRYRNSAAVNGVEITPNEAKELCWMTSTYYYLLKDNFCDVKHMLVD